jgi:hypothetical protein
VGFVMCVCMCGFCNVRVCVGFEMCVFVCVGVCMYGFCNVCVCVSMYVWVL